MRGRPWAVRAARSTLFKQHMTTAAHLIFTPFDEYLKLESGSEFRHEWIKGHVYAMSRGTPEHGRLTAAVVRALPQSDECRVYSSDTLLYIEAVQHSTYADASIVCGAIITHGARDKNGKSLGEAITNPQVVVKCCRNPRSDVIERSASCCFSSSNRWWNTFSSPRRND